MSAIDKENQFKKVQMPLKLYRKYFFTVYSSKIYWRWSEGKWNARKTLGKNI